MDKKIRIADIAKDSITGFEGVVYAKTEWYNGCIKFLIQPKEMKDGKPIEPEWFDAEQLIKVDEGVRSYSERVREPTGGPDKGGKEISAPKSSRAKFPNR